MEGISAPPIYYCLKLFRANTAQMTTAAYAIVERFDVFCDMFRRGLPIFANVLLDAFLLETAEERLGHSVIPAIASTTHAGL